MVKTAVARLHAAPEPRKTVFVASSNEPSMARLTEEFVSAFESQRGGGIDFHYTPFAAESHATVDHPAALLAFRTVLAPIPSPTTAKEPIGLSQNDSPASH